MIKSSHEIAKRKADNKLQIKNCFAQLLGKEQKNHYRNCPLTLTTKCIYIYKFTYLYISQLHYYMVAINI